ncbi:polysaccharide pyruvyl transferase family protein [Rubrivivax gelatinosus]|uniref:Polysaccharide pyruvyl transferase n=1 Tax=Rubrivivax gelatinosus TaxID=28068 RepID=A0A4R2LZK1_RUBGE|nr:polysaccharide pyruvyl transferase family protein [Rubrivivax gelatinosus]TCO97146.1 polysaccharide pyruvyl transferase [Rubrivivax gelatinosus]
MTRTQPIWLDLDCRGNMRGAFALDAAALAQRSGQNLGNLVFRRALENAVDLDDAVAMDYSVASRVSPDRRPSHLVVSAANWLADDAIAERDNDYRRRLFESFDCPVVVFGLGAQCALDTRPTLGPKTRDLIRLLGERSRSISVRDTLTAELIHDAGVPHAVVTGCPSSLLNLDPALGATLQRRAGALDTLDYAEMRVHVTETSGGHARSADAMHAGLAILRDSPSFMVVQEPELLPFLLRETPRLPAAYAEHAQALGCSGRELEILLRQRTLFFSSVDGWMDFARTCDLSIGMRLHGAMIALQAGVPALLVTHDERTRGLGETMALPRLDPQSFVALQRQQLRGVGARVQEALEGYDANRQRLARLMLDHARRNGLMARPEFVDFCSATARPAETERRPPRLAVAA